MTATPTPKPRSRDRKVGLAIVAAIVLAVGAVSAGYAVGAMPPSDAASAGANPSETPERPAPETSTPAAPEPSAAPVSRVPATCAGIYSTDWAAQMGGLVLNPAWINEPGQPAVFGSADDTLIAVLQAADPLSCRWGSEAGGGDRFLVTNVTSLSGSQPAEVLARLAELGLSCYDELGGTRCIIEATDDNGFSGESHFVRGEVWLATRWMNIAPDGYTHDIVNTLWK
ncbi:hypothetical protein [Microterricola viridarii]|uniref:Uncharacterized protein n=1 Tax=Microterricola viridarii TaxID=412690 RepID=A0A1H1PVV6_9MICO|nr:hypothetical protein [Microterricola viridarii]SDS15253.1 hypothetical protein SAMN04489834_0956 [Microterricola viridarii]